VGEFPRNWAVRNLVTWRLLGAILKMKAKITRILEVRFKIRRRRNPRAALEGGLETELGWLRAAVHLGSG